MRLILLCAGFGTRLLPLTEDRPKALLPVRGRALVDDVLQDRVDLLAVREQLVELGLAQD